jgi:hypothetical protein
MKTNKTKTTWQYWEHKTQDEDKQNKNRLAILGTQNMKIKKTTTKKTKKMSNMDPPKTGCEPRCW